MRIQHNVTALNAYRNLRGNNTNLAKNLEKLSSGYRINRAGDDAAGLAVSEKMRAQITGLDAATKNAQDGISLVQTAEGALTEVHSMLNRMVTLATQSANGTYDNEVDRANLQKEVVSLKSEIDRISESSNYNGIKLLDGSLSNGAKKSNLPNVTVNGITGQAAADGVADVIEVTKAADYKFSGAFATNAQFTASGNKFANAGDTIRSQIKYNDASGKENVIDIALVSGADKKIDMSKSSVKLNGKALDISKLNIDNSKTVEAQAGNNNSTMSVADVLSKIEEFSDLFDVTAAKDNAGTAGADGSNASHIYVKAKKSGTSAEVTSILTNSDATAANANKPAGLKLKDAMLENVASKIKDQITVHGTGIFSVAKKGGTLTLEEEIKKATIEVNGVKFAYVTEAAKNDKDVITALKNAGIKSENILYTEASGAIGTQTAMTDKDTKRMVELINKTLGEDVASVDSTTKTDIVFEGKNLKGNDNGLTLQIGDTSDTFNKMTVSVDSMSTKGLNIGDIDVSTQSGASAAMDRIKNAINSVSSTRGDLGALQNRLEHTINNLGVMHENITEAESRIRDTDMAKEMMAYAKNNILVQSATAMLAQANQLPQGVLQLLQ